MERYAYIRVSTKEQNVDRKLLALEPYQTPEKHVYCDYQSGKNFERPAYRKLMKKLKAGDLLIVKSIDRLGRNYNEILVQWQYITKEVPYAERPEPKPFLRPVMSRWRSEAEERSAVQQTVIREIPIVLFVAEKLRREAALQRLDISGTVA